MKNVLQVLAVMAVGVVAEITEIGTMDECKQCYTISEDAGGFLQGDTTSAQTSLVCRDFATVTSVCCSGATVDIDSCRANQAYTCATGTTDAG